MPILSLKGVLLGCLDQSIFSLCEEDSPDFTNFLHNPIDNFYFLSENVLSASAYWRNIPLEKKKKSADIIYVSALPQLLASYQNNSRYKTLTQVSDRLVSQLRQVRFEVGQSDLDHQGDRLRLMAQLWDEFKIETRRAGWITFHLSKKGIEIWMNQSQNFLHSPKKYETDSLKLAAQSQFDLAQLHPSQANLADQDHTVLDAEENAKVPLEEAVVPEATITEPLENSTIQFFQDPGRSPADFSVTSNPANAPCEDLAEGPTRGAMQRYRQTIAEPPQYQQARAQSAPTDVAIATRVMPADQSQKVDEWLWQVQYTHARGCSLLRLWADSASVAGVSLPGASAAVGAATVASDCVASGCVESCWVDRLYEDSQACLLIRALVALADDMFWIPYRWPFQQYFLLLKAATVSCQAFDAFYRRSLSGFGRGFSQLSSGSETVHASGDGSAFDYFDARFGLVRSTQNILEMLLQQYLAAKAPTDL